MSKTLRLFGLPRTGTNVHQEAVSESFDCDVVQGDNRHSVWKHGCYRRQDDRPVIVVVRHPLSFLWATWKVAGPTKTRQRYQDCRDFAEFIRYRTIETRENPVLHEWSFAYGYWLRYEQKNPKVHIWRWEDFLMDPELQLKNIGERYELERNGDLWVPQRQVGPHHTRRGGFDLIRRQELEEHEYLDHYDEDTLKFAVERIDPDVAGSLGYELPNV